MKTENTAPAIHAEIQDGTQILSFIINQMQPVQLDRWLHNALKILNRRAVVEDKESLRVIKKLAASQFLSLACVPGSTQEELETLGGQLLQCCSHVVDGIRKVCTPEYLDTVVQDVTTVFLLYRATLKHNLDGLEQIEITKLRTGPVESAAAQTKQEETNV